MDEEVFATLLSPQGDALMGAIAHAPTKTSSLALGTALRRDHPAELVAAAMSQHGLRQRARSKFGDVAERMWFTPDALEQSTRFSVAQHRAARLSALGVSAIVDLGCGIGGDLIACGLAGIRVRGVELDPVRAAIAQANLNALGIDGTVTVGDATTTVIGSDEVAFVDPARRDGRGRVFSLGGLQPPWDFVRELLAGKAVAKVMPGIAHEDVPAGVEAEWVSDSGALVEASLWGAGFASTISRRATVLPSGTSLSNTDAIVATGPAQQFLIEPDDAIIRAGIVAEFAELIDGRLLDPKIAWVSSDQEPTGKAAFLGSWFRVIEQVPFHPKPLKAALQSHDIGTLTIKKRGVELVPEELIKKLKLKGSQSGTVVMTRLDNAGVAYLVDPLPHRRLVKA